MREIVKLKSFDNTKKLYEDRKVYVENIFSKVDVSYLVGIYLYDEYNMNNLEKSLEDLGTYLLMSNDIDNERKIRLQFYRDEKRYRQYAIGKNTISTDFSNKGILPNDIFIEKEGYKEEYIFRLFDPEKLTIKEKRNILKIGVPNICRINDKHIIEEIDCFLSYCIDKTKNGKEMLIINYVSQGLTDKEISNKIKVPRRTISEIISRVIA